MGAYLLKRDMRIKDLDLCDQVYFTRPDSNVIMRVLNMSLDFTWRFERWTKSVGRDF